MKIYNDDCFNIFPQIESKSIDLILTDLPYGVTANKKDIALPFNDYVVIDGKRYENKKDLFFDMFGKLWDTKQGFNQYWNENSSLGLWSHFDRISKDNASIVLFGQGIFFSDMIQSNRDNFKYDLVWDKKLISGFLNANRMPLRVHENIAVFYKKQPTYNPQFTEGKPLHSKGKSYLTKEHKNDNYGDFEMTDDSRAGSTQKHPKSILEFQKPHPSKAQHRTEKSIPLLEWLIKTYSNEGDLVLDCSMGSGTTGIACKNTNRDFIGIEIDYEYFYLTKNRLGI